MLAVLRDHGWRVLGTERSAGAVQFAKDTNGIPMVVGDLDQIGDREQFDLIILFHVLEHLTEPLAMLRQCALLLKPGGMMVVAVPNLASWQARICGRSWFHLDLPRHRHHFPPAALDLALEKSGFRVSHTSTVSFEHDPFGWLQSLLNLVGFEQNLLTKRLMGIGERRADLQVSVGMVLLSGLLIPLSVLSSVASWIVGAGATVEKWAIKP
jgi:SAM-dependent methyltransferase